jgi:hypothetical protein
VADPEYGGGVEGKSKPPPPTSRDILNVVDISLAQRAGIARSRNPGYCQCPPTLQETICAASALNVNGPECQNPLAARPKRADNPLGHCERRGPFLLGYAEVIKDPADQGANKNGRRNMTGRLSFRQLLLPHHVHRGCQRLCGAHLSRRSPTLRHRNQNS